MLRFLGGCLIGWSRFIMTRPQEKKGNSLGAWNIWRADTQLRGWRKTSRPKLGIYCCLSLLWLTYNSVMNNSLVTALLIILLILAILYILPRVF